MPAGPVAASALGTQPLNQLYFQDGAIKRVRDPPCELWQACLVTFSVLRRQSTGQFDTLPACRGVRTKRTTQQLWSWIVYATVWNLVICSFDALWRVLGLTFVLDMLRRHMTMQSTYRRSYATATS